MPCALCGGLPLPLLFPKVKRNGALPRQLLQALDELRAYTKEQKIKKEIARLKRVFKDLDKNKLQTVESLIKNAAFMAVSLEELQEIINAEGYVVEYQNGENQKGTKQSDAVKTHIAMTKNHAAIIKQLTDLVPPEKKKESKLQALRDE